MSCEMKSSEGDCLSDNIIKFDLCSDSIKELIQAAEKIRTNAYAPYSQYQVGAAVRTANGEIFTGVNVENIHFRYAPSICAERAAMVRAITEGHKKFHSIAVVAIYENAFTTPCGVCRHFMSEFLTTGEDINVYCSNPKPENVLVTSARKLLPFFFAKNCNFDKYN